MAENKQKSDLKKDEMKKVSGGKVLRVEPSVQKVRNKTQAGGALKRMAPDRERPTRER